MLALIRREQVGVVVRERKAQRWRRRREVIVLGWRQRLLLLLLLLRHLARIGRLFVCSRDVLFQKTESRYASHGVSVVRIACFVLEVKGIGEKTGKKEVGKERAVCDWNLARIVPSFSLRLRRHVSADLG